MTGLSQHLRESRHTPNWEDIEILAKENNIVKRKLKESCNYAWDKRQPMEQKGGESYKWHIECNNYSNQSKLVFSSLRTNKLVFNR